MIKKNQARALKKFVAANVGVTAIRCTNAYKGITDNCWT